jgi:dihydrofolate reductase
MMRKLILQMHISVDGFIAAANGVPISTWDDAVREFSIANTRNVDCIIIGRKTAKDLIPHWASVAAKPSHADYAIGKIITETPKIVFSRTLAKSKWPDTTVIKGGIVEEINRLKKRKGKDILVYGGAGFASSLVKHRLIDEYCLLVNPVALGCGSPLFSTLEKTLTLTLVEYKQFACGTMMIRYRPKQEGEQSYGSF